MNDRPGSAKGGDRPAPSGRSGGVGRPDAVEARINLAWKWLLFAVETGVSPVLAPGAPASPAFWVTAALWLAYALAYTAVLASRPAVGRAPLMTYASYLLDLGFLSLLTYLSGDAHSVYVFLVPAHVLWLAVVRPYPRDVVLAGVTGFVAYVVVHAAINRGAEFLSHPRLWIEVAFLGFLVGGPLYRLFLLLGTYREAEAARAMAERSLSRLERDNRRLQELSFTDPLTGLYNKRYFDRRLAEDIGRAGLTGQPVALMLVDIDYFKNFNDTHGHVRGNELLKAVAAILSENCRVGDVVCRYGGEEFALILPATGAEAAAACAERIRRAVEQHPFLGRETQPLGRVTVSAGIAVYPTDASDAAGLVESADRALYRAKDAGRNAVVLHASLAACVGSGTEAEDALLTLSSVVQTLLGLAQLKDRYTYGHAERVAEYASAIASRLGLAPAVVRRVRYAALAHDLGNAAIASRILLKESSLTEEERRTLQQHTLLGVSLIEPFGDLRELIPIIASHHERWDGSGYPAGLRGDAIPLESRILAVADSFDAMCQHRPYRRALSLVEAAEELARGAGSRYDPQVVRAFLEILGEGCHEVCERLPELRAKTAAGGAGEAGGPAGGAGAAGA